MPKVTSNPFPPCDLTSQGAQLTYGPGQYPEAVEFGNFFRQALPQFHASEMEAYYGDPAYSQDIWLSPFYQTREFDYEMARWPDGRIRVPIYTHEQVRSSDDFNNRSSRTKIGTLDACDDPGQNAGLGNLCNRNIKYTTFNTGVRYVDGELNEFHDRSEIICLETFKRIQDKAAWWNNLKRAMIGRTLAQRANDMRHMVISTSRMMFSTLNNISNYHSAAQYGYPAFNPNDQYVLPNWQGLQFLHSQMIGDSGNGAEYINGIPFGYLNASPELIQLIIQQDSDYREVWHNTGLDPNMAFKPIGSSVRTFSHWIMRPDHNNVRIKMVIDEQTGQTVRRFVSRMKPVKNTDGTGFTMVADPLFDEAEFELVHLTFKGTHMRTISPEQVNTWRGVFGGMFGSEVSPLQWATALQAATGQYIFTQDNPLPLVDDCDDADNTFYNKGLYIASFRQGIMVVNPMRCVSLLVPNPNRVCRPNWGKVICLNPINKIDDESCDIKVRTFGPACDECSDGQRIELDTELKNIIDICKTPEPAFTWTFCRKKCFTGEINIPFQTQNGTALAGTHYTATNGVLSWADGEKGCKTITVPIIADPLVEDLNGLHMAVVFDIPEGVTVNCSNLVGVIHQPCNPCVEVPVGQLPIAQP